VRLFVAVVPPAAVVQHLDAALVPVRAAHPGLGWVPCERWHLTLAFYGEVADADVARARTRVARAAKSVGPLDLRFTGSGRFGDRVLWIGVRGQRDELRALARDVDTDGRPYRPHLTVARARRNGIDPRDAAAMLATYEGPPWTAREVLLVRSYLGPRPRHEPVARWPLGDG
jgi:2'-5' RNA ligase